MFTLVVREDPIPETLRALFVEAAWQSAPLLREQLPLAEQRACFGRCLEAAKGAMESAPTADVRLLMELREGQLLGVLAKVGARIAARWLVRGVRCFNYCPAPPWHRWSLLAASHRWLLLCCARRGRWRRRQVSCRSPWRWRRRRSPAW